MYSETSATPKEVHTFEEYTVYSLEQSLAGVLDMMERSKQVSTQWPAVPALIAAAEICKEVAALACFQNSLDEAVGTIAGDTGARWEEARKALQTVMDEMADTVAMNDEDTAVSLFGSTLPGALHLFAEIIPVLTAHIQDTFMTDKAVALEDSIHTRVS